MYPRTEMLDLVVIDGRRAASSRAIWSPAQIESHVADAVVLATGGYGNVYYLSTNAKGSNARPSGGPTSAAPLRESVFHADSSHLHSGLRRLSIETHSDERVASERRAHLGSKNKGDKRPPNEIPERERDYYLERRYPELRQSGAARCCIA